MSWDGTLGSVSEQDLFDSRYSDDQRIVVGNIPIDAREEDMENLFLSFGKVLEVVFFAKALTGPKSKCNYAYITLESADQVQQVLDKRPFYYPTDPNEKKIKLTIKRKETKSSSDRNSTSSDGKTSSEAKNTTTKDGITQNGLSSTEAKNTSKKDGTIQNGKAAVSKKTEEKNGAKKNSNKSTDPKNTEQKNDGKSTESKNTSKQGTIQNGKAVESKDSKQTNDTKENSKKSTNPKDNAQKNGAKENSKSIESKDTEQKKDVKSTEIKDITKKDAQSKDPKDKTDGCTQTGKFAESKKKSESDDKESTDSGVFCGFEGMQHVCRELKITGREIYDKLASLANRSTAIEDQVCYVLGLLEKVKFKNEFPVGKNDEVADWLRKKGNMYYNEGCDGIRCTKTALDYYSLSLCMANNYSLQIAQAIGNKSACFADLDYPQAVANHIKIVITQFRDLIPAALEKKLMARIKMVVTRLLPVGAPPELHTKLLQSAFDWSPLEFRRSPYIVQPVLDFNAMSTETFTGVEITPSLGDNPKIPTMSSMVRLQYNEQFGRHLVAGRRIEPGDVIMRTSVGAAVLNTDHYELSHCSYCLRFVTQLIPCSSCPFESFCDNTCLQMAEQSYHWALCGLIGELNYGPPLAHMKMNLALRLLMRHLSKYYIGVRMFDFIKEVSKYESEGAAACKGGDSNKTHIPGLNKKGVYDHRDFRTVYYMWSKAELLSSETRRSLAISCAYNMHVVTQSPEFFKNERNLSASKKTELKQFLTLILYRVRVGLEWNCFEVTDHLQYTVRNFANYNCPSFVIKSQHRSIGLFYCSTLSLFNHACYSNCLYTEQMNGTIIVRALGTIEKGEQLTIPYFSYWQTSKQDKIQLLKEMGSFQCQCMGCTYNWDSDPNQSKQSFNDLTLTPMCFKCRTPKTVKPDKESKKCNKCKDVIDIKELRAMVQSLVLSAKIGASQLQITSRSHITQDLTILQGLQAMTLPHTCRELIELRSSMMYNLSRGDKCYVRPILRTDTVKTKIDIQDVLDNVLEKDVFEFEYAMMM